MKLLHLPWYIYCGMAAFVICAVMVAMGSRMPFKLHRRMGYTALLLMIAHVLGIFGIF